MRDPIEYDSGAINLYVYSADDATNSIDPYGLKECKITIYGGHNFNVKPAVESDYPGGIPPTDCVTGVSCAIADPNIANGKPLPPPKYFCKKYPCNSFPVPGTNGITNPVQGVKAYDACAYMQKTLKAAEAAAQKMLKGQPVNPAGKDCLQPQCDSVTIVIKCDSTFTALFKNGAWKSGNIGKQYWEGCNKMCGSSQSIDKE